MRILVLDTNKEIEKIKHTDDIEYEILVKQLPDWSKNNIDNFYQMELDWARAQIIQSKGIPSIMAAELVKFMTPIIAEMPGTQFRGKWSIALQTNYLQEAILYTKNPKYKKLRGKKILIPPKTVFNLIGFKIINKLGIPHQDQTMLIYSLFDDITVGTYHDIISRGCTYVSYGSSDFARGMITYIQQFDGFDHMEANYGDNKYVIFNNDAEAMAKMAELIGELARVRKYYSTNYSSMIRTIKMPPAQIPKKISYEPAPIFSQFTVQFLKDNLPGVKIRNYMSSLYLTLKKANLWNLYNQIQIMGVTKDSGRELAKHAAHMKIVDCGRMLDNKRDKITLMLMKKSAITKQKFGANIEYYLLPKSKQQIVDKIYIADNNKEAAPPTADAASKYKAIRQLYSAFSAFKIKEKIQEALELLDENDLGPKKSGDHNLKYGLCEHTLYRAELHLAGESLKNIRNKIIKKYCSPADDKYLQENADGYYCEVCGEKVFDKIQEDSVQFVDGQIVSSGPEYDPLYDKIYKETAAIVRSTIRFKDIPDTRPIIKSISKTIESKINSIESKILKIKTNVKDNYDDLILLYINIYAFAVLAHLIYINKGSIFFAKLDSAQFSPNGQSKSPKERLYNIINTAIHLIKYTKKYLFVNIHSIKYTEVKSQLIAAYKWVLDLQILDIKEKLDKNDIKMNIAQWLSADPLFHYLYWTYRYKAPIHINNLKLILGRDLDALEKEHKKNNIYDAAPIIAEDYFTRSATNDAARKIAEYRYLSYKHTIIYIKDNIYRERVMPPSIRRQNYDAEWNKINSIEKNLKFAAINAADWPFHTPKYKSDKIDIPKLYLPKIYRRDGTLHDWSIFVFTSKKNPTNKKELVRQDIVRMLDNGENIHAHYYLSDQKDPKTNEYMSKVKNYTAEININSAKIRARYQFFKYFQNRCPISNLHEFVDFKCKKCGFIAQNSWINSGAGISYYGSYKNVLEKQEKILENVFKLEIARATAKPPANHTKAALPKFSDTLDENKIIGLAQKFDINYDDIVKLGTADGGGTVRISKLNAYYMYIIYTYYLLKNYQTTYDLSIKLTELINSINTKGLQNIMEDIHNPDYYKIMLYYTHCDYDLDKVANYMINLIISTISKIFTIFAQHKFKDFGFKFVKLILDDILFKEKIYSNDIIPDIEEDSAALDNDFIEETAEEASWETFSLDQADIDSPNRGED